jgi:uncharacterized protein YecE (DUF72 family)
MLAMSRDIGASRAQGKTAAPRISVGVAGWSYPDWEGIVYPAGERRSLDRLRYLAGFVDVIEINNTFYRPPAQSVVAGWRRRVADLADFRFTVKLWRRFTHMREEKWRPQELVDFLRRVRPLLEGGKGGALLAQFPHSFHRTVENVEYLEELLRQIEGISVAVELRHRSWDSPDTYSMLDGLGAGICSIDQPMFSGSLAPIDRVTGGLGYIRLHGRNREHWFNEKSGRDERYDYLYSDEELEPWIGRARAMSEEGAEEVYVITNNHFRGQEVCNALMLKSALTGRRVKAPAGLIEHFPALAEKADPDAPVQETLL